VIIWGFLLRVRISLSIIGISYFFSLKVNLSAAAVARRLMVAGSGVTLIGLLVCSMLPELSLNFRKNSKGPSSFILTLKTD